MHKKILLLTAGLCLVGGTAFAGINQFSDVPRGHWSYESIQRLAREGIIDSRYQEYGGDRLLTRYEAAQLVGRAMAKHAYVGPLEKEYAEELNSLGVRVAALEKKESNVQILGHIRYSYKAIKPNDGFSEGRLRNLLWFVGNINDNWKFITRLESDYRTNGILSDAALANGTQEQMDFNQFHLDWYNRDTHVRLGRQGITYHDIIDTNFDGVLMEHGKREKLYFEGFAGRYMQEPGHFNNVSGTGSADDPFSPGLFVPYGDKHWTYMVSLSKRIGAFTPTVRWWHTTGEYARHIMELETHTKVGSKWDFQLSYIYGDQRQGRELRKAMIGNAHHGYVVQATYGTMHELKPGSFSLYAKFSDRPLATFYTPVVFTGWTSFPQRNQVYEKDGEYYQSAWGALTDGFWGWETGIKYCIAPHLTACVRYIHLHDRNNRFRDNAQVRTIWSEIVFTF